MVRAGTVVLMNHKPLDHVKLIKHPDSRMKGVGWALKYPGILAGGGTPHSGAFMFRAVPEGQLQEVRPQFVPHCT